ncbi:Putative esterase [Actinokineospora sp. UTMC 2448]|nr:Putative esterase [Actinokineospora sp. UTMC 2448]
MASGVRPLARTVGAAGQRVPEPIVRREWVYSAARGRVVGMVSVLPTELLVQDLPVCLFLHGRGGTAATAFPGRLARWLVRQVAYDKAPPFAFVAVDGGDGYWHEMGGDDPMGMLLREVPGWLAERRLGRVFAVAGISMGGFGALLYARRRAEAGAPVRAAAAISPALITTWDEMRKRGAFRSEEEWLALDPRHNVPRDTPIAVWCGAQDSFARGTREFIERADPEVGYLGPGGHDGRFYDRVVPDLVTFLAAHR